MSLTPCGPRIHPVCTSCTTMHYYKTSLRDSDKITASRTIHSSHTTIMDAVAIIHIPSTCRTLPLWMLWSSPTYHPLVAHCHHGCRGHHPHTIHWSQTAIMDAVVITHIPSTRRTLPSWMLWPPWLRALWFGSAISSKFQVLNEAIIEAWGRCTKWHSFFTILWSTHLPIYLRIYWLLNQSNVLCFSYGYNLLLKSSTLFNFRYLIDVNLLNY